MMNRTEVIKRSFRKNLDTYDAHATAQNIISNVLHDIIINHYQKKPRSILEIGCGTGFLTRNIINSYIPQHYYLNDLNEQVTELLAKYIKDCPHTFLIGDAQTIEMPFNIDLVISASTLQWFNNPQNIFKKIANLLSDEGYFFFSTFGSQNLQEIKQLTSQGLEYLQCTELKTILEDDFEIFFVFEEIISLTFNSPINILKHLKYTGVTGPFSTIWTKAKLDRFVENYATLWQDESRSFPLTYHPIYFGMRKRKI